MQLNFGEVGQNFYLLIMLMIAGQVAIVKL